MTDYPEFEPCSLCEHPEHGMTECEQVIGYDHLNGDHECGCIGPLPDLL